jgi:YD repeat-containing protein
VDGFGEIIQEVSPARGTITSWYDCGGNLTKTVDADSVETDYADDAANRRTSMSSPGAISSTYVWDQTSGGSFGIGRLSGASVAADSVSYVYDAQGRVASQAVAITDSGHASPFTVGYAYDANGRVIQVTYPSGDVVNLTRTTDGLVTAVTETLASGGAAQPIASNVAFEPFGPLAGLTYGNGLVLTRAYDQDYQLTGLSTAPASGPALLNVTPSPGRRTRGSPGSPTTPGPAAAPPSAIRPPVGSARRAGRGAPRASPSTPTATRLPRRSPRRPRRRRPTLTTDSSG